MLGRGGVYPGLSLRPQQRQCLGRDLRSGRVDGQASVTWHCSAGRGLFSTTQSLPVPPQAGAGGPRAAHQPTAE